MGQPSRTLHDVTGEPGASAVRQSSQERQIARTYAPTRRLRKPLRRLCAEQFVRSASVGASRQRSTTFHIDGESYRMRHRARAEKLRKAVAGK